MKKTFLIEQWDLQAFAGQEPESAEAAPEDAIGQATGEQAETIPDAGESEDFETLIRGRYKREFDERVQKILDGRLKKARNEQEQYRRDRAQREQAAKRALEKLGKDAPAVQKRYPDFDWRREMENEAFGRLIAAGCDAMSAYEMTHRAELMQRAMAYSAQTTREKIARSLASGSRVAENGSLARSAAVLQTDPGKLTSRELSDIRKRVLSGEKIKF